MPSNAPVLDICAIPINSAVMCSAKHASLSTRSVEMRPRLTMTKPRSRPGLENTAGVCFTPDSHHDEASF